MLRTGEPEPPSLAGLECDLWSLGVMIFVVLTDEHPFCSTVAWAEKNVDFFRVEIFRELKKGGVSGWMTECKMGKRGKGKGKRILRVSIGVVGAWCVAKMLKGDELLMEKCFWRIWQTDTRRLTIKHKDSWTNTHLQNNIHVRPMRDLHSSTQQKWSQILSGHPHFYSWVRTNL